MKTNKSLSIHLILKQIFRLLFLFFLFGMFLLFYRCSYLIAVYQIILILWFGFILFKIVKNSNKVKIKIFSIIFLGIGISFMILRIVDIFYPLHISIIYFTNIYNGIIILFVIFYFFIKRILEIVHITGDEPLEKVIKINEKLVNYLDEGIFYDDIGCGLHFLTLNVILVSLSFVLGTMFLVPLIPNLQFAKFKCELKYFCFMGFPVFLFLYAIGLYIITDWKKKKRYEISFYTCALCNIILDLILNFQKMLFSELIIVQLISVLYYLLGKIKDLYFGLRKDMLGNEIVNIEEFYKRFSKDLNETLSYSPINQPLNIYGSKAVIHNFVDATCEFQKKIIKCGKLLEDQRLMYYDYTLRIDCRSCKDAEEVCQKTLNMLKKYFEFKYGFIIGKSYIIELLNRVSKMNFSFLKKFGSPSFDEDCSRINVIIDNYDGYADNIEWTRKIFIFASSLNFHITLVSEKEVQVPNESFSIKHYKLQS